MQIISLRNADLAFGHHKLLDGVNLDIVQNKRTCLIGRNGAGKSSLLKVIQGQIAPDSGERIVHNNANIAWLEQDVPKNESGTVFEVVLAGLGSLGQTLVAYQQQLHEDLSIEANLDKLGQLQKEIDEKHGWNIQNDAEKIISKLSLDGDIKFNDLSGGLKRRALLAKSLVTSPDLLMLDEPTNHLDIESIEFLEQFLPQYKGSILFITHDRQFLRNVATEIIELDRGKILQFPGNYEQFLTHKEEYLHAESVQNANFDKKLKQEEVWIRQGVKARRTRNEGRVRALETMRKERQLRREKMNTASFSTSQGNKSSKVVIRAENISFSYENKPIFKSFSCEIQRGDKIAILGKNGCGKSTLLQVMLEKLKPTTGTVTHGENLQAAYFDQLRDQINPTMSLVDNVVEGSDYIEINDQKIHIIGYLQKFLFDPKRMQSPASSLSGGERNRLLLAKLFAKPSNVLILDEPTNDLDVETLEVLENLILDYQGTVLIVSHDRSFINNVATNTIVFEPNFMLEEYVGGYDEWLRQSKTNYATKTKQKVTTKIKQQTEKLKTEPSKPKLSLTQTTELANLPKKIDEIEHDIAQLEKQMADPDFYQQNKMDIQKVQRQFAKQTVLLTQKYALWEQLIELES